jgi:hypothetical protein
MQARLPGSILLGAAILLLSACGGDDETTVTVEKTAPATSGESTTTVTTQTETVTGDHGPKAFSTPSGNIGCYVDGSGARCDIAERSWKPTPDEQGCELDYGQGITVDATHAEFVCAGDTTLGAKTVLGYGQSAQRGPFLCESEQSGVTCSEQVNGHGFFISRESFRIF